MNKLLMLICALALLAGPAAAATWVLQADGSGDFPTLWAAVLGSAPGDVIELADGVFTGDGNRDILLYQPLTLRSQSGDPASCVIDCDGAAGDPHRALHIAAGHTGTSIEGITFRNGYLEGSGAGDGYGAAVFCEQDVDVSFSNCRFEQCHSSSRGGAVGYDQCGTLTLEDCAFVGNVSALSGAGVGGSGAGMVVRRCSFQGNQAGDTDAAALMLWDWLAAQHYLVEDCDFVDNGGAGLYVIGTADVVGCRFAGNSRGGVDILVNAYHIMLVQDCVFEGNTNGAALRIWHLTGAHAEDLVTVRRCLFAGNAGGDGTLFAVGVPSHIHDLTFWGNDAPHALKLHGPVSSDYGVGSLVERVIVAGGSSTEALGCYASATYAVHCTDFHGGWSGCAADWLGNDGNIDADPMFCDPEAGEFTLHASSPCLGVNNDCGTMGLYDLGCGTTGVEDASFGAVKALY